MEDTCLHTSQTTPAEAAAAGANAKKAKKVRARRASAAAEAEALARFAAEFDEEANQAVRREWSQGLARKQVVQLQYGLLHRATSSFGAQRVLGTGASCTVFAGELFGTRVAVKRMEAGGPEWHAKQFASEMDLLVRISHPVMSRHPHATRPSTSVTAITEMHRFVKFPDVSFWWCDTCGDSPNVRRTYVDPAPWFKPGNRRTSAACWRSPTTARLAASRWSSATAARWLSAWRHPLQRRLHSRRTEGLAAAVAAVAVAAVAAMAAAAAAQLQSHRCNGSTGRG
jgi:hypothetical protein